MECLAIWYIIFSIVRYKELKIKKEELKKLVVAFGDRIIF